MVGSGVVFALVEAIVIGTPRHGDNRHQGGKGKGRDLLRGESEVLGNEVQKRVATLYQPCTSPVPGVTEFT